MKTADLVRRAFYDAQSRRPYKADAEIIKATTPPGGEWNAIVKVGAPSRLIVWNQTEVAIVNPRGQLNDTIEGEIAMALRAAPVMDSALRSILVLAEDAQNLAVIRELAIAVVAFIEMPAPRLMSEPEDSDDNEGRG